MYYRADEYNPSPVLDKIEDPGVREMVENMLSKVINSIAQNSAYLCTQWRDVFTCKQKKINYIFLQEK